ncbi:MAG: serine hydrolase [Rhodothermales bacterium]|nr:serine hydrolase [Rhodothermales bacterium]
MIAFFGINAWAQPEQGVSGPEEPDADLEVLLGALVEGFAGDVGVYVRHLESGRYAEINGDSLFPTASMIKVPILLKTFDLIEKDALAYDSMLVYRDSLLYAGEDILGSFADGEKISLSKVVMLMITTSDNTASLWLQHLVGTGTEINAWLASEGFENTRVNSRTAGRHPDWQRFGWGQTTPREMAELLVRIYDGEAISPAASEEMYRVLTRIYWNDEALSQIPPFVQVMSKQGAVSRSRSEVVLVNAPGGAYVFCVITNDQADSRWTYDNEGYLLLRDVSRALWHFFEPESSWKPPAGMDRYWE